MRTEIVAQISTADWIKIVLASGVVAAVLTKILDGLLARFQRKSEQRHQNTTQQLALTHDTQMQERALKHQQDMQEAEQTHQSEMQRESREDESLRLLIAAHDEAREGLLESAVGAEEWLSSEMNRTHGLDYDFSPENEPHPGLDDITEVIAALHEIEVRHPTRSVRRKARQLRGNLSAHYGTIDTEWDSSLREYVPKVGVRPSADQFFNWIEKAQDLVELIHTPPTSEDIKPWPVRAATGQ